MSAAELRPKVFVGAEEHEGLIGAFSPHTLHFHRNHSSILEQLYRAESAMILLPANEASSHLLAQKIRKDHYIEILPIVLFGAKALRGRSRAFLFLRGE
ncbi:MAG: hypothetical protein R3A80_06585 [Bdellovibrionota bacterium]